MIDHEAEIFHSVERIEEVIGEMRVMADRHERLAQTAEGFGPAGTEWKTIWLRSANMLRSAIDNLLEEKAYLIQLQIDALEKRRLDRYRSPENGKDFDLTAEGAEVRRGN